MLYVYLYEVFKFENYREIAVNGGEKNDEGEDVKSIHLKIV